MATRPTFLLALLVTLVLAGWMPAAPVASAASAAAVPFGLAVHGPISILSNADFTAANGVVSGTGTAANPYVISGWAITNPTGDGITIQDTNASFVIRGCLVTNGTAYNAALSFLNVTDGTIENLTFEYGWTYGAMLTGVTHVTLSNSTFKDIGSNVNLLNAADVTVSNNTFPTSSSVGISANLTTDSVFRNNTVAQAYLGIYVGSSSGMTVAGNHVSLSSTGVAFSHSSGTVASNLLQSNGDGLSAVGSTNLTVVRNTIVGSAGTGIALALSTAVLVYHNALWNNGLQASDDMGPQNAWDDGYPAGGNFWSNYTGVDKCSGPLQNNCTGPDGIGDTPYVIDSNSTDRYPLMTANGTGALLSPVNVTLYGSAVSGWGFSASTMSIPGPTLTVPRGAPVNLHLVSADGATHEWFLDLNNNTVPDPGEPISPLFNATAPANFSFTRTGAGTFTYRCEFHPVTMVGLMVFEGAVPATTVSLAGTQGLNGWFTSPVKVTMSVSGPGLGPLTTHYRIDGGAWVTYEAPFTISAIGAHLLAYYSNDSAGDTESVHMTSIDIDVAGPVVLVNFTGTLGTPGWFTSAVAWTVTDVYSVAPPVAVWCQADSVAHDPCPGSGVFASDGTHFFTYNATDAAGLRTATVTDPIRVDTQPPTSSLQLDGTQNGGWYSTDVAGAVFATDATSGVLRTELRIDNGSWSATDLFRLTDGVHYIQYYSVDVAGNVEPTRSAVVRVDSHGSAFYSLGPTGIVTSSSVTLFWSATNNLSGIRFYAISVDGGDDIDMANATSYTVSLADGVHVVRVIAVSNAGSVVNATIAFDVDANPLSPTGPYGSAIPIAAFAIAVVAAVALAWDLAMRRRPKRPASAHEPPDAVADLPPGDSGRP